MGNTASSDLQQATDEVAAQQDGPPTPEAFASIKLYQFVKAGTTGGWELAANSATPKFYDANEDSRSAKPDWYLEVDSGNIDTRADEGLQYVADRPAKRVTFAANGGLWALKFPSPETYSAFFSQLQDKVFYNTYGLENDDAGRSKALGADFKDTFFSAGRADANIAPMEVDESPEVDQPAPGERLMERATPSKAAGTPIQGLVMGATDNSYLLRGDTFDVMRNVEGGVEDKGISFQLTPVRGARGGDPFTPSKVIMAERETKMNLLSPNDRNTVYHADVEYQKVVSEWRFAKDTVEIPQADIATDTKASQLEDGSTFLGLDANRLCRWDMRDPTGRVQEVGASPAVMSYEGGKDYARGTNFSCMATSGEGYVVVGSKDGKLRLYNNKSLTQAKTSIPGLGKPITAVDVTYDARWILATTDDYLIVVKTTFDDGAANELNSFTARGGGKLALPRLLRLKPEDVILTGGKPFRHGRFTWVTENGRQERWIVASCGNHSVVWNMRRVKTAAATSTSFGGLPTSMDYHLSKKEEEVVDSNFMHDKFTPVAGGRHRDSLVVATPHKVFSLAS